MLDLNAGPTTVAAERLLTVSNRGPVEHHWNDEGEVEAVGGQGGLANALRVTAQIQPMTWLSSPLTDVDRLIARKKVAPPEGGGASHFVLAPPQQYDLFYGRFSNEVLWFLQHCLPFPQDLTSSDLRDAWENGYQPVNRAFAEAVIEEIDTGPIRAVMFHDYHFYTAPLEVRRARPNAYLQHFIHIPWPGPEEWARLERPIATAICEGMVANDSVVFQTHESAENFLHTCFEYLPSCEIDLSAGVLSTGGRKVRAWANGISVDPAELEEAAATPDFSRYRWLLRPAPGQKTIMRVDRLDLTKNVVKGFEAYRSLLLDHPELQGTVQFLALLVPSKSDIPAYRQYQDQTLALAESINREFGRGGWKPIRLIFEHNRVQALAAMSLYDVLLVNPVADGMNLVAKEGPMLNTHNGVLVLSTKAGAHEELGPASIPVEPEDVEGTAEALHRALTMPARERSDMAQRLKAIIRTHDLRDWFEALMDDIERHAPIPARPSVV
jgi:trehalose 6-phosphate synthase